MRHDVLRAGCVIQCFRPVHQAVLQILHEMGASHWTRQALCKEHVACLTHVVSVHVNGGSVTQTVPAGLCVDANRGAPLVNQA